MESPSFKDILNQKIGSLKSGNSENKLEQNPFQQSVSELHPKLFLLHFQAPKTPSMKAYVKTPHSPLTPKKGPSKGPSQGPKKTFEIRVKKEDLDPIGASKWVRFEKMVGKSFENSVSEEQILRVFRNHLKKHHPDLTGQESSFLDFALMVKIKNELIHTLKNQISKNATESSTRPSADKK